MYKVQPKFGRCTLFFRSFTVVPYRRALSEKFSKPCTLKTPLFRNEKFTDFPKIITFFPF